MATAVGRRTLTWSAGLTTLLIAVVITSAAIGPVWIPPVVISKVLLSAILTALAGLVNATSPIGFEVPDTAVTIVTTLRLPRITLAAVVGFALGTA
ncbi:MAG: iron ABC transporter, partial [Halobacteriales archaeon]|nr:iron ABC transporter [Halobacteriales archaeon]